LNSKLKNISIFEKRLEKYNEIEIEITQLKTQIGKFDSSLKLNQQQISISIESMRSDISAVQNSIHPIKPVMLDIQNDIGDLRSKFKRLKSFSETMQKRLSVIEQQIVDMSEMKTDIAQFKIQCDEIDCSLKLFQQHFVKSNEVIETSEPIEVIETMDAEIDGIQKCMIDPEKQLSKSSQSSHVKMKSMIIGCSTQP
jgi:chromosome segregation ATPase